MIGFVLVLAVLDGLAWGLASRLTTTTLWAGRAIAPVEAEPLTGPTGFQSGISPGWLVALNVASNAGFIALLIGGSFVRWWLGLAAFVIGLGLGTVTSTMVPKDVAPYLRLIIISLVNREADYRRRGDIARADGAALFAGKLVRLLETAVSSGLRAPATMREAKKAAFGQVQSSESPA